MSLIPTLQAIRLRAFSNRWFLQLPEAVREAALARTKPREFQRGERIFNFDDQADGMYFIEDGAVQLDSPTRDGREVILDIYGAGTWFGDSSPLIGFPRLYGAVCHNKTRAHFMRTQDIFLTCNEYPEFNNGMLQLLAMKIATLTVSLQMYQALTVEQKLAFRMLMLEDSFGRPDKGKSILNIKLSQENIARMVGPTTRQRVNQILGEWDDAGILSSLYGVITIKDRRKLEKIIEESD